MGHQFLGDVMPDPRKEVLKMDEVYEKEVVIGFLDTAEDVDQQDL